MTGRIYLNPESYDKHFIAVHTEKYIKIKLKEQLIYKETYVVFGLGHVINI